MGLEHLMSRLDSKEKGVIIVVQQRVHLNDLSGYLIESGGWEVLSLAGIAEEDETVAIGEKSKRPNSLSRQPAVQPLLTLKQKTFPRTLKQKARRFLRWRKRAR